MSQQNVLESAKQGNPNAIAALINRNLQQKGIAAKVSRKDACLRIMLESSDVPNQSPLVEFIGDGIKKLQVVGIDTLQVFGRQTGEDMPAWSQSIVLRTDSPSISRNQPLNSISHSNKGKLVTEDEAGFRVKHNGQELVASNIEELKEWVQTGRIALTDYVYNPILQRWMYVREMAEVEFIVNQQQSSTQAIQYNQMSFIFGGIGLLMLFIFPIAGVVLLTIGIVFSAMYYTRKGSANASTSALTHTNSQLSSQAKSPKSRVTTALLAILIGGLGLHFFYLEAWGWGLVSILSFWTYLPAIAGLILGIRYLTMSDKEFERKARKIKGPFGPIEF